MNQVTPVSTDLLSQAKSCLAAGDLKQALGYAVALLKQNPHSKEAYTLAGQVMQTAGDWAKAEAYYLQALYIDTYHAPAQLAFMQHYLARDLTGYEQALRTQLQKTPDHMFVVDILTDHYWVHQQWPQLYALVEEAKTLKGLSNIIKEKISIKVLLANYLEGTLASVDECNQRASSHEGETGDPRHVKNLQGLRRFLQYLTELLAYQKTHPEHYQDPVDKKLTCIGDSHAFGMAQMNVMLERAPHQCSAQCMIGIKAHHFSANNADILATIGRQYFKHALAAIPKASHVLIAIGEIDCRLDEGILHVIQTHQKPLEKTVKLTVHHYVQALAELNKPHRHRLILCTVPPLSKRIQELNEEVHGAEGIKHIPTLKEIIKRFNHHLKEQAETHGFEVLDTYTDHIASDGFAKPEIHLDATHLKPDVVAQALAEL